jgi:ribosomal protein S12 methylthiotransferase
MSSASKDNGVRVAVVNLGCDKNRVDSEVMSGLLEEAGFQLTSEQDAEVIIVNTCAFILDAKKESVETLLELAGYKDHGSCRLILAAGCLAQRYADELLREMPELDGVIGTGGVGSIVESVRRAANGERVREVGPPGFLSPRVLPRVLSGAPYTAYLKIAEGCDNRCAYCVIPDLRGPHRSRQPSQLFREAEQLVAGGVRELILVAQDTTRYGSDLGDGTNLAGLVSRLADLDGLKWLRLLYCHPAGITRELVEALAREPKVCRYLDIPMQHASDTVLRRMGRKVCRDDLFKLVDFLRRSTPGLVIRSTFMVGFPGETEAEFEELLSFLREVRLDRAGFFAYSREEGTAAARMPGQVPEELKQERLARAAALQREISLLRNRARVGSEVTVLVEGRRGEDYFGRTEGDAPDIDGCVFFQSALELAPGDFIQVRITRAGSYDLWGEIT